MSDSTQVPRPPFAEGKSAPAALGGSDLERRAVQRLMQQGKALAYRRRVGPPALLLAVSEQCEALLGMTAAALIEAKVDYAQWIHPEDRPRVSAQIDAALQGDGQLALEYRLLRPDGALRWVLEHSQLLSSDDGSGVELEGLLQDVTRLRLALEASQDSERRYRSLFEHALEGIFQTSPEGRYLTVNPALARLYGYDSPEQLMSDLRDIGHELYVDPQRRQTFKTIMEREGLVSGFESEIYRRDGSVIWISEHARAVRDRAGRILYYEGMVENITERKRHEFLLRHQLTHDALTGLPNRLHLQSRFQELRAQSPAESRCALAFIDLDHFKLVNDSLGHAAGDELLKITASRLQACIPEDALVARLGGDEFAILIGGDFALQRMEGVLQQVLRTVCKPLRLHAREVSVGCSIGVARAPEDGLDIESLMRCADFAMYRAKADGRNIARYYRADMSAQSGDRLKLLAQLHQAVARDEFFLVYEPKCDLRDGRIVGVEALLRWNSPNGLVSPAVFIPLAEDTGLIESIGEWVLREACAQCRRWQEAGLPAIPISVNLSRRQLLQLDFPERVAQILRETGLAPACLELEVTESALMQDVDHATAMLHRLAALGLTVSMDDFGTGYSSLSCLRRFPVECLKIDRSFIQDAARDADAAAIVKAIISMGRSLGLRVLAEGVETQDQYEFLRAVDCDQFQGWLKTRPLDAGRFSALLAAA